MLAEGKSLQEAELKGVEEFAVECSILKVAGSENAQRCSDEGLQMFGGMGFSADAPMEMAWRDSRIARIYEGTNEINRMLSVGMTLKKALKGEIDLMTPATAVGQELMSGSIEKVTASKALLRQDKQLIDNLKKDIMMNVGSAVPKYGSNTDEA